MKPERKKLLKLGEQNGFKIEEQLVENRKQKFNFSLLSQASEVGFSIALPITAGALFGLWLDGKFSTKPVLTLVFLFLGIFIAFFSLYVIVQDFSKKDN
jgi:ATP synthase protein I